MTPTVVNLAVPTSVPVVNPAVTSAPQVSLAVPTTFPHVCRSTLSPPVPVDQSTLSLSKSISSSLHESPPLQSSSSVLATSPISKFLVYPTPVKKTKVSPTANKCARILTSTESLQLLEEKEKKKKEEAEEKARRTKEEARKRKAEERAMRAEQTEKRKTMTKKMKIANIAAPTKVYPKRRELQRGAAYQEISVSRDQQRYVLCLFGFVEG